MASRNEVAKQRSEQTDIEDELNLLEQLLDRCRTMYEQYFMGMQRMPPSQLHRKAERTLLKLTQIKINNTGQRFRFNTLSQKFGSYNTYWKRTLRQIEQGKYLPHLKATARRRAREGKEMPDELLQQLPKRLRERIIHDRDLARKRHARDEARAGHAPVADDEARDAGDLADDGDGEPAVVRQPRPYAHTVASGGDDFDFDAMFDAIKVGDSSKSPAAPAPGAKAPAPAKPAPRPAAAPPPAAARAAAANRGATSEGDRLPPGMSERETRDLFDKYVKARKLVGAGGDVSYKSLLKTLNKQAPKILEQHKASRVEFNVVIKDDRVVLKAKPKKD